MGLIATKKQYRYQNTRSQGLGFPVAFLWRLSGHNPRDQDSGYVSKMSSFGMFRYDKNIPK